MKIAVLTFDGFNELDSFIACSILNRANLPGWKACITCPSDIVTSMNGVVVHAQQPLRYAAEADVVLIGSGVRTRQVVGDEGIMSNIVLDPRRQLIGSQCSGALFLLRLDLLDGAPVCTDSRTRPELEAAGLSVLDAAFHARGNIATAGGCLASHYLAAWVLCRGAGTALAR